MPIDAVVADRFSEQMQIQKMLRSKRFQLIGKHLILVQKQLNFIAEVIKKSKLVIWNGPMGVFEIDKFANGTKAVAESIGRSRYIFRSLVVEILQQQ